MMALFWLLLGVVVVFAFGWLVSPKWRDDDLEAEEIVRRRYANGEIDRETYERMLDDLWRDAERRTAHR